MYLINIMAAKGKRTHTILDNTIGDNKIVKILYGHGKDYIVWPNTHIIVHGEESYADVTKAIMRSINEDKVVNIPGGEYKSDHDRLNFLRKYIDEEENKAVGSITGGAVYKEIVLIREDGTREHYSKWDSLNIQY